jgi:pilus assembly protein CpaF
MLHIEIRQPDGTVTYVEAPEESVIGKGAQSEVRLDSWRVGREHARLFKTASGIVVEDLGAFGGVQVNDRRMEAQFGPLAETDIIAIGHYRLRVVDKLANARNKAASAVAAAAPGAAMLSTPGPALALPEASTAHDAAARREPGGADSGRPQPASARRQDSAAFTGQIQGSPTGGAAADQERRRHEFEWRRKVHAQLLETMDLRRHDISSMSDELLRAETDKLVGQLIDGLGEAIPATLDRAQLRKQVLDEAIGLGPLEELLADDSVSEIMVNRFDEIYVERAGQLSRHPLSFTGDRAVMGVIERIVAPLGRRIDESSPMVDARLKDGSRVNAIIPPLALKGACLTIRKFSRRKLDAQDLVRYGSLNQAMARFLEVCVVSRKNVIVSGGTGSGKTTLLNILSNFIPDAERIITVEDAAELKLHHAHLISLESRPPNVEGKGAVPIRELVKNTLRMRPDRIVVGECRGAEALDMLQAMNTGHEGSLTTLHANTPRDGLARLETMVLMAGMDLPLIAIREQICSAVDIVVQQTRFACGTRMVTSITEITGIESGKIQIQELFRFQSQGYGANGKVRGFFTGCDIVPGFYEELRATGKDLDMDIFRPAVAAEAAP